MADPYNIEWPHSVEAPWNDVQVASINYLQQYGDEKRKHHCHNTLHKEGRRVWEGPLMIATRDGMVCPDEACPCVGRSVWPVELMRGRHLLLKIIDSPEMKRAALWADVIGRPLPEGPPGGKPGPV